MRCLLSFISSSCLLIIASTFLTVSLFLSLFLFYCLYSSLLNNCHVFLIAAHIVHFKWLDSSNRGKSYDKTSPRDMHKNGNVQDGDVLTLSLISHSLHPSLSLFPLKSFIHISKPIYSSNEFFNQWYVYDLIYPKKLWTNWVQWNISILQNWFKNSCRNYYKKKRKWQPNQVHRFPSWELGDKKKEQENPEYFSKFYSKWKESSEYSLPLKNF